MLIYSARRRAFFRSKLNLTIIAILTISSLPAAAELGGNMATVQADQKHLQGTRNVTSNAAYDVHEIKTATGATVREFVSPAGAVFAVAWQGSWKPDLQQIMGPYFAQYLQAIQAKRIKRGPISLQINGLIVESGGHPRSFTGRAYLPQMMPQGITSAAIR
jgi:hypothetical protein